MNRVIRAVAGAATVAMGCFCASTAGAETVNLICIGEGARNETTVSSAHVQSSSGDAAWGTAYGERAVPFEDQVDIQLDGTTGKVRMPRAMLPTIRGGKDGWFEIEKVKWSDDEIRGVVQVSFVNSPKLRVDRRTGRVTISGKSGDYAGTCQPYDPAQIERKF